LFYRLKRTIRYVRFHHQIARLLDTPPIQVKNAPFVIVSMVAAYDTRLYILAIKALYRRLGQGKIVIISDGLSEASKDIIRHHVQGIEIVPLESIDTGPIQHGGTWERLVYCIDRTVTDYVIQMDADVLCVGPIPEVLDCLAHNRAFNLADGIPKKPLDQWVKDGIARKTDNVVFAFEKKAPNYPGAADLLYLRGSSGFAGFARGAVDRRFLEDFYQKSKDLMGPRWREWGTEQIASNFIIANSPGSIGLPKPKYLTWERHEIPQDLSLLHFLGYCRFDQGVFTRFANREIDTLLLTESESLVPAGHKL
jgi:hypothetical protein